MSEEQKSEKKDLEIDKFLTIDSRLRKIEFFCPASKAFSEAEDRDEAKNKYLKKKVNRI